MQSLTANHSTDPGETPAVGAAVSRTVGWFSLARATAELVAPAQTARALGLHPSTLVTTLLRVHGVASLASGAAILLQPRRPEPMWSRVVADVLDVGLVGVLAFGKKSNHWRSALALAGLVGITALDSLAAVKITKLQDAAQQPVMFSVTINKPPVEVYTYVRELSHLATIMETPIDPAQLDIIEDRPGELIAWRSLPDAAHAHEGRITFAKAPGRHSTEVRVEMTALGSRLLAKLFAKPEIKGDLRRLKQIMETGEVLLSDASRVHGMHPAQPSAEPMDHTPKLAFETSGSGRPKRTSSGTGAHDGGPTPPAALPNLPNGKEVVS